MQRTIDFDDLMTISVTNLRMPVAILRNTPANNQQMRNHVSITLSHEVIQVLYKYDLFM